MFPLGGIRNKMSKFSARGRATTLAVLTGAGIASLSFAIPAGAAVAPHAIKTVKITPTCTVKLSGATIGSAAYTVSAQTETSATAAKPGAAVSLNDVQFKVTIPGKYIMDAVNFGFKEAWGSVTTLDIVASDAKTGTGTHNAASPAIVFATSSKPIVFNSTEEKNGLTLTLPAKAETVKGYVAGSTKGNMTFTSGPIAIAATFKGSGTEPVTVSCTSTKTALNTQAVS
jgi:hypothetical protein